jgi:hypothetical protein
MKKKTERRYGRLRLQSAFVAQLAQNRDFTHNPSLRLKRLDGGLAQLFGELRR